jgi:protocatechuate 3,4-dioxygenase beta subunit
MANRTLRRVDRRDALQAMGSVVGLAFLGGCGGSAPTASVGSPGSAGSSGSVASTNAACVVTPQLTEGPYFVDEGLNRSDIRTDPATGAARPGVPLELTIALSQMASTSCAPLAGALVDVWHCDALGVYSDVAQQGSTGHAFLRGYQVSAASGVVRFATIYPGWYQGRAVHLHFKIRTNPTGSRGLEVTSQMFFDDALTDIVHDQRRAGPPRATRRGRRGIRRHVPRRRAGLSAPG